MLQGKIVDAADAIRRAGSLSRLGSNSKLVSAQFVRAVQRQRARRHTFISSRLFSDPAWDMLLELYACGLEKRAVSVTALSTACGVPQTTGLRWVGALESEKLILRRPDPKTGGVSSSNFPNGRAA